MIAGNRNCALAGHTYFLLAYPIAARAFHKQTLVYFLKFWVRPGAIQRGFFWPVEAHIGGKKKRDRRLPAFIVLDNQSPMTFPFQPMVKCPFVFNANRRGILRFQYVLTAK